MDSATTPTVPGSGLDADLVAGQLVGEYRIEEKIGQGGFGAVWRAAHPLIGKLAAIKVLSHRFSVDPEMVSRFVAEARAVNQIRHHNIIDIFAFGALDDGRHYYVMEYLEGEPLDKKIKRDKKLPLAEALPILRGVARAVDAAHAKGIAHRDLKAENVFLAQHPDGVMPKLLDFGIAKLLGPEDGVVHKTRTGAPMGTPHYMSPEQCHGRDVDHRTDLYAFGVLAYVMLTGGYPIDGEDYMTILMRQIHDDPPPVSSRVPGLPAGVDCVVATLMHKQAAKRPPSLGEAVRELERAASGAPVGTGPAWHPVLSSAETQPMLGTASEIRTKPAGPAALAAAAVEPVATTKRWPWVAGGLAVLAGVAFAAVRLTAGAGPGESTRPRDETASVEPTQVAPIPTRTEAASAPAANAQPAEVMLTIDGTPVGTEVRRNGALLGIAPGRIQLPRADAEVILVLAADGYAPSTISVTPSRDQARHVELVRKGVHAPARTPAPASRPPPHKPAAPTPDEPTNDIEQFPTKP